MSVTEGYFTQPLILSYSPALSSRLKTDIWSVEHGFRFYVGGYREARYVEVPAGFAVSGKTLAAPFRWLTPIWGGYGQALVLYSFLCQSPQIQYGEVTYPLSRKEIEQLFCEALAVLGISPLIERYLSMMFTVGRVFKIPVDATTDKRANQLTLFH